VNDKLLETYESELRYFRELSAEFAETYPKVAGRLAINSESGEAKDPFVERLLEGVAFLTSRVRLKMDAEFSTLTQSILETVAPDFLSPVPSMAMVQFLPDGNLKERATVKRGTQLRSRLNAKEATRCLFQTSHELDLWPLLIAREGEKESRYFERDLDKLGLPMGLKAKSALRIVLKTSPSVENFSKLKGFDGLPIFIAENESDAGVLFEAFFANTSAVVLRPGSDSKSLRARVIPISEEPLRRVGFGGDEAILPEGGQSQSGFRLIREFFAMPHRFLSVAVSGLRAAVESLAEDSVEIIFVFNRPVPVLEQIVKPNTFQLFVTPAANLFEKRTNNLLTSTRRNEYHLIADRARPLDFEILSVKKIFGYGSQNVEPVEFSPFFRRSVGTQGRGNYFSIRREPRRLGAREKQSKTAATYAGSEVFASLVGGALPGGLREIGAETICSNRHLPIELRASGRIEFLADSDAPVDSILCLVGPTSPSISWAEGEMGWKMVDHLSLNYQALFDEKTDAGAYLREMMCLYQPEAKGSEYHWIQGIRDARCNGIVRPCPSRDGIAYARGLQIQLMLDEEKFIGSSPFLFGSVMSEFFSRYVSINSFTETTVTSRQRGEMITWPGRIGQRHLV